MRIQHEEVFVIIYAGIKKGLSQSMACFELYIMETTFVEQSLSLSMDRLPNDLFHMTTILRHASSTSSEHLLPADENALSCILNTPVLQRHPLSESFWSGK